MSEKTTILLSPSQVNTALDCRRKWGFSYIDLIKDPPTEAQAFGLRLHALAEEWLTKGAVPDLATPEGKLFVKGLEFLPLPTPANRLEVENAFRFEDGDLAWRGFVDLITPGDPPRVTDHKTTSSFRWAKNPGELSEDTQAIIYGKFLLDRDGLDRVEIQWIYYLKGRKPQAKEVIATLTREQINDRYAKLRVIGEELLTLKKTKKTALDIPVEKFPHAGCSSYGGCNHFETCQKLHKKEEKKMSLSLLQKLQGMENNAPKQEAAPPAPPVAEVHPAPVASINPPTPLRDQLVQEAAVVAATDAPKKKTRGRPKGSKNKGKAAAPVEAPPAPVKAPAPVEDPHAQMKGIMAPVIEEVATLSDAYTDPETGTAYALFIDCVPSSGAGNIDTILRTATINAADVGGVDHYRLIEFGKGPATLCVEVRKLLNAAADEATLPARVVVNSSNQCVQDAMPELEAFASEVVRALR